MSPLTRTTVVVLLVASAALGAACETTYKVPDQPVGAIGEAALTVFDGDGRLKDPFGDADGDGISNRDELEGWLITVDVNGYALIASGVDLLEERLEKRTVSSDPRWADTDGDGLTDGEERQLKCDPRRADTDGDTLFDLEEARRFGTSPASVDSDGDARNGDALLPPLFQLFDGGELRLEPDPSNPGGPKVIGAGATSPVLPDSDGDGVNDYVETLASLRSPSVADIPRVRVLPTPGGVIDMYFNTTRSDSTKDSRTFGTSTLVEEAGRMGSRSTVGIAQESSTYAEVFTAAEAEGGCCNNLGGAALEVGLRHEATATLTASVSLQTEAEFAVDTNHIRNEVVAAESAEAVTIDGGTLRVMLDVHNYGPVTVRMVGLVVGVTRLDRGSGLYVPVGELTAQSDFTLAPSERRTVQLANEDIPVQAMLDLFADPSSLVFTPSRYDLRDQDGLDFDFTLADVMNTTAAIEIDDGLGSDKHWVAANIDPTRGTTIGRALSEIGIDYEAVPVDGDGQPGVEVWKLRIGLRDTELWGGAAPPLGDTLPYTRSGGPGPRLIKRGWFGLVTRADAAAGEETFYANLFDAPLFPGDFVTLVYTEDLDRDGLSAAEERALGSSDLSPASDATTGRPGGDGLSDFWEAREGVPIEVPGVVPYQAYSSPTSLDTDGDGLGDEIEVAVTKSDPRLVDTDGDGFSDRFEHEDTTYGLDPSSRQDDLPVPTVTCTIESRRVGDDWYYALSAGATDAEGDLRTLVVRFLHLDAELPVTSPTPVATLEARRLFDDCVDPSHFEVTATDALGLTGRVACTWMRTVQGDDVVESGCQPEPNWGPGGEWKTPAYE
ncbi:MAG: hypothetical protein IT385_19815 [Deltaproteobacteria bacterium]|nr:hypothetical protein [Deltaproteobacteria bacterium]